MLGNFGAFRWFRGLGKGLVKFERVTLNCGAFETDYGEGTSVAHA